MAGSPEMHNRFNSLKIENYFVSYLPDSHLISSDRLNSLYDRKLSSRRRSNPLRSRKHNGPASKKMPLKFI